MAVKKYKPTTPGRRFMSVSDFEELTRQKKPEKQLLKKKKRISGRNNVGRITMRRRGGGNRRKIRVIDFKRHKDGIPAKVTAIEYDPNRSARLALLIYADGTKAYIIAPDGVKVGDTLQSGEGSEIKKGNTLELRNIPVGSIIHNLELQPSKGAQVARSAGTYVTLMAKEEPYAFIRMPSGEVRKVRLECRATMGVVGNTLHARINIGKAGRNRWLGKRPKVRGMVMNPNDHPHGGGEGRSKSGRHPVSPWGTPTKGHRTRKKKQSDKLIISRRRTGKKK